MHKQRKPAILVRALICSSEAWNLRDGCRGGGNAHDEDSLFPSLLTIEPAIVHELAPVKRSHCKIACGAYLISLTIGV